MKKTILLAVIILTAHAGFGQSPWKRFHFGIKGGANYSDFTNAGFETEGLTGFHGGLIVNFDITDRLSIQEDFLYSTQGAKIKNGFSLKDQDLKLSYLSVPIVLKYHSNIGLYGEIGGQANMLLEDAKNTGYKDFAEKIDAGAVAGIGYQFKTGPVKGLGIGARYYYGFTDVGKFTSSSIGSDFRNNVLQASVFCIF
ncbi:porin family protein [Parafilimonas sp.]|uniref:porin family protein n=1 Tax=Parafilimonas sp. TaxID=1969739 RepID=UPI0039E696A2